MSEGGFHGVTQRLLAVIRRQIRSGDLSERRLAKLADVSQPHMHNVLAGKRGLAPAVGDRLLGVLGLSLSELAAGIETPSPELATPFLEGVVGAGRAFPRVAPGRFTRYFDQTRLRGLEQPCLARIADEETAMAPTLLPRDDILLECGWRARRMLRHAAVYVIEWEGSSYLCRCHASPGALITMVERPSQSPPPPRIALGTLRVEDVVRGEVVWFGRTLPRL